MATIDLPAIVAYIRNATGVDKVNYFGHSQGATMGLAGFAASPTLASQVKLFIAAAPVASLPGSEAPPLPHSSDFSSHPDRDLKDHLINAFSDVQNEAAWARQLGSHEVLPYSKLSMLLSAGCKMFSSVVFVVLKKLGDASAEPDPHSDADPPPGVADDLDPATLPVHVGHIPAGTSARQSHTRWIPTSTLA